MATNDGDAELAAEMVQLLGRELRVARKRIEELEFELSKGAVSSDDGRVEELEQEVTTLRRQLADLERSQAREYDVAKKV